MRDAGPRPTRDGGHPGGHGPGAGSQRGVPRLRASASAGAGALCLVDTGVHANPDTSPGLVSATALDGGSGEDVDPQGHGTTMAMIAGAAGAGMVGAWPQLKIVSVRATEQPSPGQEPTFEFNDYCRGHPAVSSGAGQLPHRRDRPGALVDDSAEPRQGSDSSRARSRRQPRRTSRSSPPRGTRPALLRSPRRNPGSSRWGRLPLSPIRRATGQEGSVCSFSANQGLTFYAPGCGLDEAEPFTDQPSCCGNGTSQASAFAAAVVVALMSYDPKPDATATPSSCWSAPPPTVI